MCVCVCVSVGCRRVCVSVHVSPGDAFKCTVYLHVYGHLDLHSAGLDQFLGVDVGYGLSPVAERAVLRQHKGFVLLFTQQREHVLHQLTQPAVTVGETGRETRKVKIETESKLLKASNVGFLSPKTFHWVDFFFRYIYILQLMQALLQL